MPTNRPRATALPARNGLCWPRWSATKASSSRNSLTRLIDKLCDNAWIERRGDETDRRVNRLYLKKAARPLLGKLSGLRSELTATALEGINPADAHRLLAQLEQVKENVRNAIQNPVSEPPRKEQRYG
jgi:MarR family transcriptional regulator for hemolysin